MPSTNEQLQDRAFRHSLALAGYDRGLQDRIIRLLNRSERALLEKLASRLALIDQRGYDLGPATTKRLKTLLAELRAINAQAYVTLSDALIPELEEFSAAEAGFQKASLNAAIGAQLADALPSPRRLRAIVTETPIQGHLLASWIEGMSASRITKIEGAIREGMTLSETTDQIVSRLRGTKAGGYRDGVMEIGRRSAQTLVRTAVSHVSNIAAQETWKANSRIVKAWQFLATLDGRTSVTCAGLSGQSFPVGEGPIPPRHPRCRSTSVPVTKSFRELGLDRDELPRAARASLDGQVPPDTTFHQWLTRKGQATQDQVLGKTRADLWRSGRLKLDDFVKADGGVLSLEELKRTYSKILF